MAILNEKLLRCPDDKARFFKRWRRIELGSGTRLFKFTSFALFDAGMTTPWWALEQPRPALRDPGLDQFLARARASGVPLSEFVRDAYSVMLMWKNSLSVPNLGLLRIQYARLIEPVYCFHGPASPVGRNRQSWEPASNHHPGGAMQVLIPNVTGDRLVGAGISLIS
jgi:hypothetical protein